MEQKPITEFTACPKCKWMNHIPLADGMLRCVHCMHEFPDPTPKQKKAVNL